ncbi:MAG: DNA-binding response regulator [Meiothermus sp.]|uniref:response regulator transcription factor n=1 Tax=Meiothermus sp. TaxID=1955249 RepID=UPI0021DD38B4|nr:response regulator transcription factor [Meiothermus sp.]GIW27302.1 MAG: DNA-binding response regulator [Meiothermus sp.]
MINILVVDDEAVVRRTLRALLERAGYVVLEATHGLEALDLLDKADLIVLDWNMPRMNGLELLRHIREERPDLPVLMLTAHDGEAERVQGLRQGADDYLGKPLRSAEFLARIEALLRRTRRYGVVKAGELELEPATQEARLRGTVLPLTPTEFALLLALARQPGLPLSRQSLFAQVWGSDPQVDERIVDHYVKRLRKKLGDNPKNPSYIETVFARGYRLKAPSE